MDRILHIE